MNSDRIKEIQKTTAYPESVSVMLALQQVWNECEQEQVKNCNIPHARGSLVCPNCGAELQLEVKEMTNRDILKALKVNDR